MKVMVMVKGDPAADAMPSAAELEEMGRYNQELADAGVMVAGEGLLPSRVGHRIRFGGHGATSVMDGPFSETKELVAGFWMFEVRDLDEAVEWARKAPMPEGTELEIRQVATEEDFGDEYTPEVREQEDRVRATLAAHEAAEQANR